MSKSFIDGSETIFRYDKNKYLFNAELYTLDGDLRYKAEALRTSNVISFSYINELNKLFLEGELVYQDNTGVIDKFIESLLVQCAIDFCVIEQTIDNSIVLEQPSKSELFSHNFIVDSIKIIKRENHIITYSLSLISSNWLKCIKNILYSNYNRQPESIFNLIKHMLAVNELNINTESFETTDNNVKINYITNGNDNTITSIKYLLSKLYYYDNKDLNLKFITYDTLTDKYSIFNTKNTITENNITMLILSLFNSKLESTVNEEPNELNSVSQCSKTQTYSNEFNIKMFDYNFNDNNFLDKSINSQSIIDYKNEFFESDEYLTKFNSFDDIKYKKNYSYWNNELDVYHASVKTLMLDNAIVINTAGVISRMPGSYININIDRNINVVENDSTKSLNDIKEKYKSLEGLYIVAKVRHIITPGKIKNNKQRYRQNLVIMRNFIYK